MSSWKIESRSFHCVHTSGLTAFIDPSPTSSGALRCVGPFSNSRGCTIESVHRAMLDLELEIQKINAFDGNFAVWGAYRDYAEFEPHRFVVLGKECGFVPNLYQRIDVLFRSEVPIWKDEWDIADHRCRHRSGIEFDFAGFEIDTMKADPAVLHPEFSYEMLRLMAALLYRRICLRAPKRSFELDLKTLQWNRCGPRAGIATQF